MTAAVAQRSPNSLSGFRVVEDRRRVLLRTFVVVDKCFDYEGEKRENTRRKRVDVSDGARTNEVEILNKWMEGREY